MRCRGGLRSVTFSKPCRADAESLRLHSRSTGKKRTLRRRPLSDDEAGVPVVKFIGQNASRQTQPQQLTGAGNHIQESMRV